MYLEDLTDLRTSKDESESCIFNWPDRPAPTLPPDYPPVDPPDCYPYCENDDWPDPPDPPPPDDDPPDPPSDTDHSIYSRCLNIRNTAATGVNFQYAYIGVEVTPIGLNASGISTPIPVFIPGITSEYLGGSNITNCRIVQTFGNRNFVVLPNFVGYAHQIVVNLKQIVNTFPDVSNFIIDIKAHVAQGFDVDPDPNPSSFSFNLDVVDGYIIPENPDLTIYAWDITNSTGSPYIGTVAKEHYWTIGASGIVFWRITFNRSMTRFSVATPHGTVILG